MAIPKDPVILLSYMNMQLRDNYPSLEEFGKANDIDVGEIEKCLSAIGYEYNTEMNKFM